MATAPYQLWIDLTPVASAVRVASTVTITTTTAHGLTSGAWVQVDSTTGAAGTSMVGVYQVTVTSGTAFTYTSVGTAGTATITSAVISNDLMNPPINFASGSDRQGAMIADVSTINLSANGDGSGATMSVSILQEATPAGGPWFSLVPDQTRIRFAYKDTGSTPAATDVLFLGYLSTYSVQLNGSGQGSITQCNLNDVNSLLDRVAVFGSSGGVVTVESATRSTNVATVRTKDDHGFVTGQTVRVKGITGGGTATFNKEAAVILASPAPTATQFSYSNTGANATDGGDVMRYSVARDGKSNDWLVFTAISPYNAWVEDGASVIIYKGTLNLTGTWGDETTMRINIYNDEPNVGRWMPPASVIRNGAQSFKVRLDKPYAFAPDGWGTFTGYVRVFQTGRVSDQSNTNGQTSVIIKGGVTETNAVKQLLAVADKYHSTDYPMQRMISTTNVAAIVGGTNFRPPEATSFPSTTLRSGLDSIIESYQGSDIKDRRYFVNPQGQLVYQLVDATAKPTYATAPYKIITSGAGTPNTTTGAATLAAYNLNVNWDHDTAKRAQFNTPSQTIQGNQVNTVIKYTDLKNDDGTTPTAKFPTRAGAPITEAIVDFPNAPSRMITNVASAWFNERYKPMLSGYFELRGAGTAAHNNQGFLKGYYQSGASTYALTAWAPGQWVDITAPSLNLSGMYRVEQVDLTFEPGSYTQVIGVAFNRKNPSDLATLIANQRK